jgi:hypothetical protein
MFCLSYLITVQLLYVLYIRVVTDEQNVYCEAYDMSQHTQVESMFGLILSRVSQLVRNHTAQPIALYKVAT